MAEKFISDNQEYQDLLIEVQQRVRSAQYQALKIVNQVY